MRFHPTVDSTDPLDEWMRRTYPFLPADDLHQACIRRAEAENLPVHEACSCETSVCHQECCCNDQSE
jgi:hypothetical protein